MNIMPTIKEEPRLFVRNCTVCNEVAEAPVLCYYDHIENNVMKVCSDKCHKIFVRSLMGIWCLIPEKKEDKLIIEDLD